MRVAYADPPYPGRAYYYREHPDYGGELPLADVVEAVRPFDGWLIHTSSPALPELLELLAGERFRIMAWVKPFAAFKADQPVAYAWEPVVVKPARLQTVSGRVVMRDWIAERITLERGFVGAKPEPVCRWAFEVLGLEPDDDLVDLYPGSGAVTRAWERWRAEPRLALEPQFESLVLELPDNTT